MTPIDYALIKKWLRYGDIQVLADQNQITRSAAYKVLAGKTRNFEFLEACYQKAIERAQTFRALQEKLQTP